MTTGMAREVKNVQKELPHPNLEQYFTVFQCLSIVTFWQVTNWKSDLTVSNIFNAGPCVALFFSSLMFCIVCSSCHRNSKEDFAFFWKCGLILPVISYILAVLFGAPFLTQWERTMSFSLLVTALVLPSVAGKLRLLGRTPTILSLEWMSSDVVWTLIGVWVSAFVIPLDWDRPWQVWPEPCCWGAVLGCCLRSLLLPLMKATGVATGFHVYLPTQLFIHKGCV